MNGEHIWGKEWGVAFLRNRDCIQEEHRMVHPAEFIGDPGAALGVLMVGLAAIALKKGYRRGPCLAWCGSDREERAAALVHSAP
jgi:3-oxoacyl-[acyl-carrier-protein] synthase-1